MSITLEQLKELIPTNKQIEQWIDPLNTVLDRYEINTPQRCAAFLAQCIHESAGFTALSENLNYRWESLRRVFPKYFPTDELARQYERQPEKIANRVYGGRMGNGDESTGDGFRYRGRGLIQLTGKSNYQAFATSIEKTLEETVAYAATPAGALESACWFWRKNGLNALADAGDIVAMTRRINGGTIGLDDRKKHYEHALKVLGA